MYRVKFSTINGESCPNWSDRASLYNATRNKKGRREAEESVQTIDYDNLFYFQLNFIMRDSWVLLLFLYWIISKYRNLWMTRIGKLWEEYSFVRIVRRREWNFLKWISNFIWSVCQCSISSEQIKWIEAQDWIETAARGVYGSLQRPLFRSKKKKKKKNRSGVWIVWKKQG